jgi:hypothetical protein
MTEQPLHNLETQLYTAGRDFPYPPTPEIARAVRERLQPDHRRQGFPARRLAFLLIAGLFLCLLFSPLLIPPVRAQLLEFIQVGIIRILLVEPSPTPSPLPPTPAPSEIPAPTNTPRPTATLLPSVLNLFGETDLDQAKRQADFTIRMPTYPADLGPPDRVFLQDLAGQVLVLVWLDPEQPARVRLSLHHYIGEDNITGTKVRPVTVETTTVNGQPAVWAVGPYLLKLGNGDYDTIRLIKGHVLIWQEGEVTYRLETDLSLEEALRIAESLQPLDEANPE